LIAGLTAVTGAQIAGVETISRRSEIHTLSPSVSAGPSVTSTVLDSADAFATVNVASGPSARTSSVAATGAINTVAASAPKHGRIEQNARHMLASLDRPNPVARNARAVSALLTRYSES
jgi:hypothetical protein